MPLMFFAGAALDYSSATGARTNLNTAADAVVLAAVTRTALATSATAAKTKLETDFRAAAGRLRGVVLTDVRASVTDAGGTREATLAYSATVATAFVRVARIETLAVSGTSASRSATPVYMDFYLVLDNSPSMGVGATPTDVAKMVNNTGDKCAFACHDVSANGNDYYALAKRLGVTMRIDVVRSATQNLMDTATATAAVAGQFRTAIYTMGASCGGTGLTSVSALTSNLTLAKSDARAVDLMTIPYQNYNNDQCSDFDGVLASANRTIPNPGDGTAVGAPQKVLFLVSDGVADAAYPSTCSRPTTNGRCQEPLTTTICTTLKNRGVKIAVLYTTYLPLPTNDWYNTWIKPFQDTIPTRMQTCASPGLYFEVSPTGGIAEAMAALFQRAVSQARITR